MKTFFTKKRILYLTIALFALITLIILLIVPIGSLERSCLVYSTRLSRVDTLNAGYIISSGLSSPFTIGQDKELILFWQTIVFTLVAIAFVVFTVLFVIELKRAGVLSRHPSKTALMQAQIDELQKQVDELKNDK